MPIVRTSCLGCVGLAVAWIGLPMLLQAADATEEMPHIDSADSPAQERERKLTEMGFACVKGDRLIGNSGSNVKDRTWLVQHVPTGDLLPMERGYPRFRAFASVRRGMGDWSDAFAYTAGMVVHFEGSFGRAFPKWRIWDDQVAFFYARAALPSPMMHYSGFHLIPFEHDARDYRRPATEHVDAMKPADAARFAGRMSRINGKLRLRTAAYVYAKAPFHALGDDHRLVGPLHSSACSGYDFVIDRKGAGLFFLAGDAKELQHDRARSGVVQGLEERASRISVLDYQMREEAGWIPKLDRDDKPAASEPKPTPRLPSRPKPAVGRKEDGIVVGLDAPGVFGARNEDGIVVGLDAPGVFGARLRRYLEPPDSVVSLKWAEKESFTVPFSVPFTAAVDDDCYFFVTNDGRIYRASPGEPEGAERTVERVFDNADDPVIACIHESATNRIFAFRRNSYLPVDNAHFTEPGSPNFVPCEDVTRPKAMTYMEEDGTLKTPDKRFQLVSRCAGVLYRDGVLERTKGTGAY